MLSNPLFSDLHSITFSTAGNLLVTSTGVDGILEVDPDDAQVVYWDWLATEQGYGRTPSGKSRSVNRAIDYRRYVSSTPEHTTHVNTALNDTPGRVLATLFHQGTLIEIDKVSKRSRILLGGLRSPHNIRRRYGGYILSDTRANRVLLLDDGFRLERELEGGFSWVQDAVELDTQSVLIADSNNDRILRVDYCRGADDSFGWKAGSRKFAAFELITVRQARAVFLPGERGGLQ